MINQNSKLLKKMSKVNSITWNMTSKSASRIAPSSPADKHLAIPFDEDARFRVLADGKPFKDYRKDLSIITITGKYTSKFKTITVELLP